MTCAIGMDDHLLHHLIREKVFNVDLKSRLLKFGRKALLNFAHVFLEWDIDQSVDVGWQFDFALVKDCHSLPSERGQKHP